MSTSTNKISRVLGSILDSGNRHERSIISILGTITIVVLWQVFFSLGLTRGFLPGPTAIINEFMNQREIIFSNFWFTARTAIVGFIVAVVLALITGITLTLNDTLRNTTMPLIAGGNTIPRITLAPLLVFYVSGFASKWLLVAWMAYFPMLLNTVEGFGQIGEDLENLLAGMGATKYQEYRYVRLPNGLPFLLDGMKISVSLSVTGAVVIEFILAQESRGLGYLVYNAMNYYDLEFMFAAVGFIALATLLVHVLLFIVQDRLIHWEESGILTTGGQS